MYCSKCGSEISNATAYCPTCGQAVSVLAPAAPALSLPNLSPISPVQMAPASPSYGAVQYSTVQYAGFWLRFVAYIIDGFISGLAFLVLLIPLFLLTGAGAALSKIGSGEDISDDVAAFLGFGFIFGLFGIIFLVSWLYRYFAKIITGMIPLAIGYILAGFTEKKQAVHDMIASCVVLRKV